MKVAHTIEEIPELETPIALTIGVFDGLHLGHQKILTKLKKQLKKKGSLALLTFSNHPTTCLNPSSPTPLIISHSHRLQLLEKFGVDLTISLPFNQQFANQSYETFFSRLRKHLPFQLLMVGEDARFGKERQGGPEQLKEMNWKTEYLPKEHFSKEPISSAAIRKALSQGDLKKAKKMLGRPFSMLLPFSNQDVIQEGKGQYKWASGAEGLCLLPPAVYAVDLSSGGKKVHGIAFYQGNQTILGSTELQLTLYAEKEFPKGNQLEVIFVSYLHNKLDPDFQLSSKASLLESLIPGLPV